MADTSPVQLVDADGEFCIAKIDEFAGTSGLLSSGLKYQIVAIMGPQSSGKSTLMNHVFGTRFQEMDAESGRRQTTRGIWMAKAPEYSEVLTMLLDLEGTDGRERGEDDTTFERQSALFALAVSDVVVINIWCHDIGREHGSGKPLIKTVLQVNLKLFTPSPNQKKTVLVFAIRDKSRTPLEKLAEVLEQDMLKIWDSIIKPPEYQETSFHDFFEVYFEGMSNYEEKEEEFEKEAKTLKKKFTLEGPQTYVRLDGKLPGDAIPLSTSKVWEVIKSHKDLDLPAHKIMVATTRCSQIQHDQLEGLVQDGCFEALLKDASEKLHEDFGERMSSLVDSCITGYDEDTMYFDADIRADKRGELVEKVTNLVKGPYEQQMKYLHEMLFQQMQKDLKVATTVDGKGFSQCATECKRTAEQQFMEKQKLLQISPIELESTAFLTGFVKAIDQLIEKLKTEKMEDVKSRVEKLFESVLSAPAADLFDAVPANLWTQARQILTSALSSADSLKRKELTGYDLSGQEWDCLDKALKDMALKLMKVRAKEAANTVLSRMKDKFSNDFTLDENQMPRTWSPKENIAKISKHARLVSADVLAQLTVFQAEGPLPAAVEIEQAIREMAQREFESNPSNASPSAKNGSIDVNVAVEWPKISADLVLIQPAAVRSSWRHFMSDTKMQITQASMTQHANKLASNRMPPVWAIIAMLFLGFDEFMAVLYSPILALTIIIFLLFIRSLYIELDVDNEMQKGALPGAVSLAGKFIPSVKSVSSKTLDSALQLFNQAPAEHTHPSDGHPTTTPAPVDDSQETMGLRRRRPMLDGDSEPASGTSSNQPSESIKDK